MRILAGIAAVVTGRATACETGVIHDCRIEGGITLVAGVALPAIGNVGGTDPQGNNAIVTIRAAAGSQTVMNVDRGLPGRCRPVAGVAFGGCADVGSARLANCT